MSRGDLIKRLRAGDATLDRTEYYALLKYHLVERSWDFYPEFSYRPAPPPSESPEDILVVQLSSIGDVTCTIPVLFALDEKYTGADIHLLSESEPAVGLRGHPALEKIWTLPAADWIEVLREGEDRRLVSEARGLIRKLKDERFDFVFNFHTSPLSAVLCSLLSPPALSGCVLTERMRPVVVGNPLQFSRFLDLSPPLHSTAINCHYAGLSPKRLKSYGRKEAEVDNSIEEKFKKYHDRTKQLILVNTGSRMEERVWPAGQCARVVEKLLEARDVEVGLVGGPDDRSRLEKILGIVDHPDLVPWHQYTDNLLEDLHLADRAELTVTTDSGPQHLISARGNESIVLGGDIWVGPWTSGSYVVSAETGGVSDIDNDRIYDVVASVLSDQTLDNNYPGKTRLYRARQSETAWFRHLPLNQDRPTPEQFRPWLRRLVLMTLLGQLGTEEGWDLSTELVEPGPREVYELYWEPPVPEVEPVVAPDIPGQIRSFFGREAVSTFLKEYHERLYAC